MDSRDHHMFSAVDSFLWEAVSGMFTSLATSVSAPLAFAEKKLKNNKKKNPAENAMLIKEAFEAGKSVVEKYKNANTLVFDTSITSFDVPVRGARASRLYNNDNNNNFNVSFSWKKTGGVVCQHFARNDKHLFNREKTKISCGDDSGGGVIEEIEAVVAGSAISGTCVSLHQELNVDRRQERVRFDRQLLQKLRQRCIGRSTCNLLTKNGQASFLDITDLHVNKSSALMVRSRCSAPSRVQVELEVTQQEEENKQEQQGKNFEIFVPLFGFNNPLISFSTSSSSSSNNNNNIKIERNQQVLASHPMISQIGRRRVVVVQQDQQQEENGKENVALVHGKINFANKLVVTLQEAPKTRRVFAVNNKNMMKKTSPLLHQLLHKREHAAEKEEEMKLTCPNKKRLLRISSIDVDSIRSSCHGVVSVAKLIDSIETQIAKGSSSCQIEQEKSLSQKCKSALMDEIKLECEN